MIDPAFRSFGQLIAQLLDFDGDIRDDRLGVHSYIYECELEAPVELDVDVAAQSVRIGSTPPLYDVDTTFRPSLHRLRLLAQRSEASDDH
jgi:hypothetical protein